MLRQPDFGARQSAPLELDGVVPYPADAVQEYRERGYWIGETHWDVLEASATRNADTVAVCDERRSLTYRELRDNALAQAAVLSATGIRRGDRVVVHFPNVVEFVETTFALFALGALPIFALPAHRASEIRYFIEFAEAAAYVTVDKAAGFDYGRLAGELENEFAGLRTVVLPLGDAVAADEHRESYRCEALPSDVAFLQLSGGTTGRPKLIPRTHDDYLYSVRESNRICGVTSDTVLLVVLPVSHNFTMSSPGILGALHVGATVVLAPNPSPDTAFELIERHRVTMVSVVPPVALAWMNSSLLQSRDLSSLQTIQVGGAKFSQSAAERIEADLGARLQQVFGMAEGLVNYTRLDDEATTVTTTQGRPISEADEVRIVDDNDRDLPAGHAGHLLTRGPYTIRGYYRAAEHNAKSFTADGFYRTGDIVTRDERGYLTVVGRAKDQINRGGEKIAPEEVENHLLAHDWVHDVSVVGIPDEYLGERSKAYVVLRTEYAATPPSSLEIRRFLRERELAAYKIPDVVEFVTEFPRTSVGKISKNEQRTPQPEPAR
ncbi:(2,3-dihydroxybenzoyl)adenylate synthase [Nocardia sp. 348MFTsu5.1]|uniref:(2,3-dihydroxybenzoyl)adenylate synthase n=1 Tax=Nocardia sp. 348MFTsu5.1 TaxID=1172185 RepID=UPI000361DBF0|nr:AMP-binding protein [Nocardia sp. 348MFTsu5.1]